jgi:hypothetical protein
MVPAASTTNSPTSTSTFYPFLYPAPISIFYQHLFYTRYPPGIEIVPRNTTHHGN